MSAADSKLFSRMLLDSSIAKAFKFGHGQRKATAVVKIMLNYYYFFPSSLEGSLFLKHPDR